MTQAPGEPGKAAPDAWRAEAERLHLRYIVEVVEHYGLCPWAAHARRTGRTSVGVVLPPEDAGPVRSLQVLEAWATDHAIEVAFLLYPRIGLARAEFDVFVSKLQEVAAERHPMGQAPFALAAFHPDAPADFATAERLVPFLRRSPDPCVQAVRMSALQRVRSGTPLGTEFVDGRFLVEFLERKEEIPLRERIARANLDTVRKAGADEVEARFDAIRRDRERTYQALAKA